MNLRDLRLRARALFANREAIHHYTQALEAAARMQPPPGDESLLGIHEARGAVWHLLTSYDAAVADLVAFLQWMAEPAQNQRVRIGVWVLLFLGLFTVIAWRMNAAFWKDVK